MTLEDLTSQCIIISVTLHFHFCRCQWWHGTIGDAFPTFEFNTSASIHDHNHCSTNQPHNKFEGGTGANHVGAAVEVVLNNAKIQVVGTRHISFAVRADVGLIGVLSISTVTTCPYFDSKKTIILILRSEENGFSARTVCLLCLLLISSHR